MPNASQVEISEPSRDESRADLGLFLREIHATKIGHLNSLHGRGRVLFAEGEPARGVYIVRSGRATMICTSRETVTRLLATLREVNVTVVTS